MIVQWTRQAINDRASIFDYLFSQNPSAAMSVDACFEQTAAHLKRFPRSGRIGIVSGTRELLPHPSYRLVYEIEGDRLTILTVIHTARQWPPFTIE